MKKIYFAPQTEVFEVSLEGHLMNISGAGGDTMQGDSNGDYTDDGTITLGSRRGNYWDDEDEY